MWKSLPVLALVAACAMTPSQRYLDLENRYSADTKASEANGLDPVGSSMNDVAYSWIMAARKSGYAEADLANATAAVVAYEAYLTTKGVKINAGNPPRTP